MPDLYRYLENDLYKPDNQIWVAWISEAEDNYSWVQDENLMDVFDIKMNYFYEGFCKFFDENFFAH